MDVQPKYARIEPINIKKFTYPPTKKQASAVKNIVDFYDFELQSFCNKYNKTGRKVLIITDDFITYRIKGNSDLDRNCIFSGEEGGVVQNILAYCMGQVKNPETVKEVAIVNWAFGSLKRDKDAKGNSAKDVANQGLANAVFYKRLCSLITDYEPDTVVLAGLDMFDYVISHLKNDFKTNHRIYTNRLISATLNDYKFQVMGCIDLKRPCSWEGVTVKDYPMLIGFLCHGLVQALQGRNSYTLRIPQDVRFINVNTIQKFDRMMRQMWKERIVSIDTETESLARVQNILYTIQFCWNGEDGYVLPVDHPDTPFTVKERKYIKASLKKYFEFGKSLYHIYQNGKFDIAVIYATLGVRYYNHRVYDIQAGEWCFDPLTYVETEIGKLVIRDLVNMPNPPRVWSWNHETQTKELKELINRLERKNDKPMVEIEYEGGSLRVTEDHEVWSVTRNAYIKAGDILEDEEVLIAE